MENLSFGIPFPCVFCPLLEYMRLDIIYRCCLYLVKYFVSDIHDSRPAYTARIVSHSRVVSKCLMPLGKMPQRPKCKINPKSLRLVHSFVTVSVDVSLFSQLCASI